MAMNEEQRAAQILTAGHASRWTADWIVSLLTAV